MKWILLLVLTICSSINYAAQALPKPLPVIDGSDAPLPKRFRIMDEQGIHIIASGQFSKDQLLQIQQKIKAPILIIDLRQESHGFVNQWPVSLYGDKNWANKEKSPSLILTEQRTWLESLATQTRAEFYRIEEKSAQGSIISAAPHSLNIQSVLSEAKLAKELGMGYKRFYIADHTPPSIQQVAEFNAFVKTIPKTTWIYFHCRGGGLAVPAPLRRFMRYTVLPRPSH